MNSAPVTAGPRCRTSPDEASREIRKRLNAIARARSFVDWQNRRGLVADLRTERRAIVDHVGKTDPKEALDLKWVFMELASSVFARCDDSAGTAIDIFHEAVNDLGRLAEAAKGDAKDLADRAFQALLDNRYGQFEHLIPKLGTALGRAGALERGNDAPAARWSCFERFLSERHLREYLKRLPDFEDIEAENGALDYAETFANFSAALMFLASWPALDHAAKLIMARAEKLNGGQRLQWRVAGS